MERTILIIGWNSFGIANIVEEFIKTGYTVDFFDYQIMEESARFNPEMGEKLISKMIQNKYDFVFSMNYFPVVSLACNACKIKYISWTYDSPLPLLYSRTIYYPYNSAFIFDKSVYEDLRERGAETVYYLPMAAPVERFDDILLTEMEREQYKAEVAFVGSTYAEKKKQIYNWMDDLSGYESGYMNGVIQAQKRIYGKLIIDKVIAPIMQELIKKFPIELYPDDMQTLDWYYSRYMVARKITALERKEVLQLLGEKYQVHLYTHHVTPELTNVSNKGYVDSSEELAKVYKNVKINLNITLRSIETGIPLRVMEIMGSGGFVISNYQEDILEHFIPGEDIVLYTDYKDLLHKVDYYLSHEEERKKIAKSGYEKVKKYHTYKNRIEEILEIIYT